MVNGYYGLFLNSESVSVLSHCDHFIAAGSKLFEMMYDKADRDEEMTDRASL